MTMPDDTILYTVLHSGPARDCAKGPVRSVPHKGAGAAHYFEGHGLVEPDLSAVRECLPYRWRKAWDRRGGVWYPRDAGEGDSKKPAYVTLNRANGRELVVIYLQPYRFRAGNAV
jgi:hypothetical protein